MNKFSSLLPIQPKITIQQKFKTSNEWIHYEKIWNILYTSKNDDGDYQIECKIIVFNSVNKLSERSNQRSWWWDKRRKILFAFRRSARRGIIVTCDYSTRATLRRTTDLKRMSFFGRKSPLEVLVMPAVCKYNQFRQRRREAQSKKVTERELNALHHKIVSLIVWLCLFND